MRTKDFILQTLKAKGRITSNDIVKALKISRQTAVQHLRELAIQKKILKTGSTIDASYIPYSASASQTHSQTNTFKTTCRLRGLQEDTLFERTDLALSLHKRLSTKAYRIVQYAFTEMVNNAIDHSHATTVSVSVAILGNDLSFTIRDRGIGAFESIRSRFRLKDAYEALEHLMKGKQTTAPERHSGQGIFFTSKTADLFCLASARLRWTMDNARSDVFVEELKAKLIGTEVRFRLRCSSTKDLKSVFDAYSNENYEFDKSRVLVRLSPKQGDYVSRSEAKRLLFGMEKFRRIVFDFRKVRSIGQGFADEIFRVFQNRHPLIRLESQNMVPAVRFMIKRALRT